MKKYLLISMMFMVLVASTGCGRKSSYEKAVDKAVKETERLQKEAFKEVEKLQKEAAKDVEKMMKNY